LRESLVAREKEIDAARDTIDQLAAEVQVGRESLLKRDAIEQNFREQLFQAEGELKKIKQSYVFRFFHKLRIFKVVNND